MLLENTGVNIPNENKVEYYVAPMGEAEAEKAFELVYAMRKSGISADFDHMGRGIKAQFKYADKIGAQKVIVIGSNELASGKVKVKNMADGSEEEADINRMLNGFLNK